MWGWFGRKGAPEAMACAYAPPFWLTGGCEEGFVRGVDGLTVLDKASGEFASFRAGSWEKGQLRGAALAIGGNQVVGARLPAIADPVGGSTVDTEARSAIATVLSRLRAHGLIAS